MFKLINYVHVYEIHELIILVGKVAIKWHLRRILQKDQKTVHLFSLSVTIAVHFSYSIRSSSLLISVYNFYV